MTLQQWVDENWPKIAERVKHPVHAKDYKNGCFYRVDGNGNNTNPENCCFIGACIPPEKYDRSFDVRDGDTSVGVIAPEVWPDLSKMTIFALADLQRIHDLYPQHMWPQLLVKWATRNDVVLPQG